MTDSKNTILPKPLGEQTAEDYSQEFSANTDYKPLELYSIQDVKTKKFMPPFFCVNEEDAIRQVSNIVNYSNSLICRFPQDYALYYLGCFDEFNGCITASIHTIDGFVAYLDEYKKEDSIMYDELKKEITQQQATIANAMQELEKKDDEFNKKIKELDDTKRKFKDEMRDFIINKSDKTTLLDRLFNL